MIILLLVILNVFSVVFVGAQAKAYLCIKYKESPTKIHLVDYKRPHIYWHYYGLPWGEDPEWADFSMEYEYNGKSFFVNRCKWLFYDDYQLEDIEEWGTKWLKENIDEHIIGFDLYSYYIYTFQYLSKPKQIHALKEADIETFLQSYLLNKDDCYDIPVVYNREFSDAAGHDGHDIIRYKISDKFKIGKVYFDSSDLEMVERKTKNSYYVKWFTEYCIKLLDEE